MKTPSYCVIDKLPANAPENCPASAITWDCGISGQDRFGGDRQWRHRLFQRYPRRYSVQLAKLYSEVYKRQGRFEANSALREYDELLSTLNFRLAGNEDALQKHAELVASSCRRISAKYQYSDASITLLGRIAKNEGINIPNRSTKGIVNRLNCSIWWRRNLRKKHRRGLEDAAKRLNFVNKRKNIYISDDSFNSYLKQLNKNKDLLKSLIAKNEENQEFTLFELNELSISNPINRRAELMARISGTEKYAKHNSHIGIFYTITCPSRMHSALAKSGDKNPKYDNTTPREAQRYLNQIWQRIRACLHRRGIPFYGLRVVEPHHDGTPHWHILAFLPAKNRKQVNAIIREYALRDSPREPGAQRRRVEEILIDWNRGSATGYVAKYVSKNIDGYRIDSDEHGNDAKSSASRVVAWASTWGIRQFQTFGVPAISPWRELRRMNSNLFPDGLIKECCKAADSGDWFLYMTKLGGIQSLGKRCPIQLLKVWSDDIGKYGEALGYVIKGIIHDCVNYLSRLHTWVIEYVRPSPVGENPLHMGKSRMVNEVERPQLGAARQGWPASTVRIRGPMSIDYRPLEFCQ